MANSDLYQQLGALIASAPNLPGDYGSAQQAWIGQAHALLKQSSSTEAQGKFSAALIGMAYASQRTASAQSIMQSLYMALAESNADAPAPLQGAYLPVGSAFEALATVGKVLAVATQSVMFVDPYADAQVLDTFAKQAAEPIGIQILADAASVKPGLRPAVTAWSAQFSGVRPLEARLAMARALHDRLIIVDRTSAWIVGQSFNALATRAPTVITRLDDETAKLKIAAHIDIWNAASPI